MSIADVTENNILNLYFRAVAIANIADNAATGPLATIFTALHSVDPGEAGTQTTNETTYTSYARATPARSTGGWTAASGGSVSPAATISFPAGTGGTGTVTHASFGKAALPTAGDIFWSGTVTPNIAVGSGVTPQLTTATTCTLD